MSSIVARVVRGSMVESVHYGAWVIVDRDGNVIGNQGNAEMTTYFRSAAKPIQALPVVELNVADHFGFTDQELVVMCASHNGEAEHTKVVAGILAKFGLDYTALKCGIHPPRDEKSRQKLIQLQQEPNQLHNNCSGKHAGMLALALYHGWEIDNYFEVDHPLQQMLLSYISQLCGLDQKEITLGIDGCGVPVFGFGIKQMATGWARLADPTGLSPKRRDAVKRLTGAMQAYPHLLAGTNRFDTEVMQAFGNYQLVAKSGAEAIYCLALPTQGWGLALKIADGNPRAVPAVILAILEQLGYSDDSNLLAKYRPLLIKNHRQDSIGKIVADLSEATFEGVV